MDVINGWAIIEEVRKNNKKMFVAKCPNCDNTVTQTKHTLAKVSQCRACWKAGVYKGGNRHAVAKVRHNLVTNQAKKRGLDMTLTNDELTELWAGNCHYCGVKPSNVMRATTKQGAEEVFVYSGLDRLDSTVGYESDNVVSCCKVCNRAKSDLTMAEFLEWIGRVSAQQGLSI